MHDYYASQFWPLSYVFVLWETQLLSSGVTCRIRGLALNASHMKESKMWTLDLKVMITAFWSKGIKFLKDKEYKTLIIFHCVCLIFFRIPNTTLQLQRIPVGVRFFAQVRTGPGAHPASCTMGTGSFLGVKQLGHGANHPPPSSAKVTKG
jgi:hypothetical protein